MWDRLNSAGDAAELLTGAATFAFYEESVERLASSVADYERHAALIAWRYTAAALVLGVAALRRVTETKPPLTVTEVEELCQEPTLGQLHEALSAPVADLVPERPPHAAVPGEYGRTVREWAKVRDPVDDVMDLIVGLAAEADAVHPRTKDEAAACLLSQHCPPDSAPTYQGALEPLFSLADRKSVV